MEMTSIKKRVGWLFGKPIVDGDSNLVTKDEIYLKDFKTLTLSVRDNNGELITPSEVNNSKDDNEDDNEDADSNAFSITSSDTLLYWASGSGDTEVYDAAIVDITKKAYSYVTSLNKSNPVYMNGKLPIVGSEFPWASKTTTNAISKNIFDITGIQLINSSINMWDEAFNFNVKVTPDGVKTPLQIVQEIDTKTISAGLQLLFKPNPMSGRSSTGTVNLSGLVLRFSDLYLEVLLSDGTVVDTIQIHKYEDPEMSTFDLRDSNKSYRVRYIEAMIEEEEAKNEPDEDYLAELIAVKELFEEWDVAAKEKAK